MGDHSAAPARHGRRVAPVLVAACASLLCQRPAGATSPPVMTSVDDALAAVAGAKIAAIALEAAATVSTLAASDSTAVATLTRYLARERRAGDGQRRAVLKAIGAEIPDANGRFTTPERLAAKQVTANDSVDWLAALVETDDIAGRGEVTADVAAIRALGASRSSAGAAAILDFAFTEAGLVFRDECGRVLRRMEPYSIPALTRGALAEAVGREDRETARRRLSMQRYATYQLERLDRQNTAKALTAAAADEGLRIAIIEAYRDTLNRDAIIPILDAVDDEAPRVRRAARAAWIEFIAGRAPPPAPMRKLELTGGKLSEEEMPLWLTSRELATIELDRRYLELLQRERDPATTLTAASEEIFALYDVRRADHHSQLIARAAAHVASGELEEAAAQYDLVLALSPDHPGRDDAAVAFAAVARARAKAKDWRGAARAYGKARLLFADPARARVASADHHYALGRALQADGDDGDAELRRALVAMPDHEAADDALDGGPIFIPGASSNWMLYAGLVGASIAVLLLLLTALLRRRAATS